VNTGVKKDTRVHRLCWSPQALRQAVFTGVQNDTHVHRPCPRPVKTGVVFGRVSKNDDRVHGPWTWEVCNSHNSSILC